MRNYFFIAAIITIMAACNADGKQGATHTSAICISDTSHSAGSVYLTTDEKNNAVISWCETDNAGKKFFYLSFFDTVSGNFSPAVNVPLVQNVLFHEEGMPKLAVKGDGSLVAVYETSLPTKENEWAGNVDYIQSFDKGKTWTAPRAVHADTAAGGSHSFAAITRLDNGEVGVCWLGQSFNYKKGGRPVKFTCTKGNNGFSNEILVDSVACECCRLAITSSARGKVSIVYRDIINDSIRDISICTSANNGQSFGTPVSFSRDNWNINGCPHNGPDIVNTADAGYAVWFTGGPSKGVYYSELNDHNDAITKKLISADGRNIQLSLLPDGARAVAYSESVREGDSLYSRIVIKKIKDGKIFTKEITPGQAHASYPVIKAFDNNKIVVAWVNNKQVYYKVLTGADINKVLPEMYNASGHTLPVGPAHRLAINTDLVCGMRIDGTVEDTTTVENKIIGFCSKHCKEKFLGNPQMYLSKMK